MESFWGGFEKQANTKMQALGASVRGALGGKALIKRPAPAAPKPAKPAPVKPGGPGGTAAHFNRSLGKLPKRNVAPQPKQKRPDTFLNRMRSFVGR